MYLKCAVSLVFKEIKTCAQAGKGFVIRLGVSMCVRACDLSVCACM